MRSIFIRAGRLAPLLLLPLLLGGGRSPSPGPVSAVLELVSNDGAYRLTVSFEPEEVPLNERFGVSFTVARSDGEPLEAEVEVDARMPGHGHGMNRDAIVERGAGGAFSAKNLLFHMPGYWEVYFDVTEGAITERAQLSIELD